MNRQSHNRLSHWQSLYAEYRLTILLVTLLALIAGPTLLANAFLNSFWHHVILSLVLLSAIASLAAEHYYRLFVLLLGIPTIVLMISGSSLTESVGDWIVVPGQFCAMIFFFVAAWMVVLALFVPTRGTHDRIMGAICGYLFLGLGWTMGFAIASELQPDAFAISEGLYEAQQNEPAPMSLLIYYSFVTLTTIGYGDISPISPAARTLAWLEAISGQFYLAIVVAGLVTVLISGSRRED